MPADGNEPVQVGATDALHHIFRYGLHLLAVYAIVYFVTMWIAAQMHETILPFLQQHPPSESSFQFAFSHLFAFSFVPALVVGFLYITWFRDGAALFVWIVPLVILAYKFATFPTTIFQNHFAAAFREYFGGAFMIPEFHNFDELFAFVAPNPDAMRGMEQLRFTAPLYAALGYSIGAYLAIHVRIPVLDAIVSSVKPSWRSRKMTQ